MALTSLLSEPSFGDFGLWACLAGALVVGLLCRCLSRLYFHPLSRVPGPRLAACTSLWLAWHTYVGDECTVIFRLHEQYGPVLRVAPNDVDIADGDATEPIYIEKGGFPKTEAYAKFDIDGHTTIFSTQTLPARASRAKAVAPLFSTASIRNSQPIIAGVIDQFVARVQREAHRHAGKPINVLNLTRSMALDAVSGYLFQEQYGGLSEDTTHMSASPFVDAYVGVGAFFNVVPGWLGDKVMGLIEMATSPSGTEDSMDAMDRYTSNLVKTASPGSGSYVSRLLEKAIPKDQVQVELKDLCFAGTDSTGMNMAMILWYLCKNPDKYAKLREEVSERVAKDEDIASGPYLRGVVREGLRLSWANPIRLPRLVPAGGWQFRDYHFPAGTSVGVAAFQLHQDEKVFPNAQQFLPERWLQPSDKMLTNFFAFGKGNRACIAQNLGTAELMLATAKVAKADLLKGATAVQSQINILEWFNSRVQGEEILIQWAT